MAPSNHDLELQLLVDRLLEFRQNSAHWRYALRGQRGPVDGAGMIIRIALGRAPADARTDPLASSKQVREGACTFIAKVFADEAADHYRVLGVPTNAEADVIKEHFRLLMSLVHPDKASGDFAWPAEVATTVTRAYEVLINPYQRGLYDAQLNAVAQPKPPASPFSNAASGSHRGRPSPAKPTAWGDDAAGGTVRKWAMRSAFGTAAVLAIGIVWYGISYMIDPYSEGFLVGTKAQEQPTTPKTEEAAPTMRLATSVSSPDSQGQRPTVKEESKPLEVAPPNVLVGVAAPAELPTARAADVMAMQRREPLPSEGKVASTASVSAPAQLPAAQSWREVKAVERPATPNPPVGRPVALAPPAVAAAPISADSSGTGSASTAVPDPVTVSLAEADTITQLFLHSYDTGNLPAMTRLFDSKEVGRQSFAWQRDDYARTFESSSQRRILVTSLNRQAETFGYRARIEGDLTLHLHSDPTPSSRNIYIELDIVKRDGKAMIARVRHGLLNRQ
jgi:DnaJ domain